MWFLWGALWNDHIVMTRWPHSQCSILWRIQMKQTVWFIDESIHPVKNPGAVFVFFYFKFSVELHPIDIFCDFLVGECKDGTRWTYINDDIYDIHEALYIHIRIRLRDACTFLLHTSIYIHVRFIHFSVCSLSLESLKTVPGEYPHRRLNADWAPERKVGESSNHQVVWKAAVSIYFI